MARLSHKFFEHKERFSLFSTLFFFLIFINSIIISKELCSGCVSLGIQFPLLLFDFNKNRKYRQRLVSPGNVKLNDDLFCSDRHMNKLMAHRASFVVVEIGPKVSSFNDT